GTAAGHVLDIDVGIAIGQAARTARTHAIEQVYGLCHGRVDVAHAVVRTGRAAAAIDEVGSHVGDDEVIARTAGHIL
ncbi:hypothetical protein ACPXBC_31275, partial [Escherichia coli]|uniref:hypothetical protein n=1 Tax=Escherichia coli TaxID=562 RepID=UPI003CE52DDA